MSHGDRSRSRSPRQHDLRPQPDLTNMPHELKKEMLTSILLALVQVGMDIVDRTLESRRGALLPSTNETVEIKENTDLEVAPTTTTAHEEMHPEPEGPAPPHSVNKNEVEVEEKSCCSTTPDSPEREDHGESGGLAHSNLQPDEDEDVIVVDDKDNWCYYQGDYITASESFWCQMEPDWDPERQCWGRKDAVSSQ